ncbi:nucleotide exchange factor GrpE [Porphyrobacter sp. HT-58-2]|uniref:nucleotide exchange factor GrpE n=1 Tax=Porphyrobacter sp. HT-58-2 TaxID=2023229 RepID=UPI000CDC5451|nr:nucleotide exchange factor GrpE [Porphyrobacter sp. HT-58-2]AUX70950.1 nucleotide exchange factor GrpE [Porphyrobacter sp. HT-58-2]
MTENEKPLDQAVEDELKGVPEHLREGGSSAGEDAMAEALESLRRDLEAARQDVLYAQAETQNVRRRLEREKDEARAYAATGFARDILSVADNLSRAIDAIPQSLREDDTMKGLVFGLEATQRELEKVFAANGITRIAAVGLPLDPNQHQAMLEVPTTDHEPGTVVSEMQSGWMIKDRLLRAAMVAVAKKPD